jgi:type 1 glutamine amidotransferase
VARGRTRPWFSWTLAVLTALLAACSGAPTTAPASASPDGGTPGDEVAPSAQTKIVFIAGGPSHGPGEHEYYAGSMLLARLLRQLPGLNPVVVRGWPADLAVFADAKTIVFFTDGNQQHPLVQGDRLATLRDTLATGVGLVCLHWAVHFPDDVADAILPLLGGYYSDLISVNPVWTANFADLPAHPADRGVPAFALLDEWYYNIHFSPETSRLSTVLQALPPDQTRFTADAALHPGRSELVSWAFERADGGRSFGFTGAHFHRNWGDAAFRRVVLNAMLWTAGREVPTDGFQADFDPAWLLENLDPK